MTQKLKQQTNFVEHHLMKQLSTNEKRQKEIDITRPKQKKKQN